MAKLPENCDSFRDALEWYVKIMSSILLALSIVVMGAGGYLIANLSSSLSELSLSAPAVATVVFGVFLFIFAFAGLYGAVRDNKIAQIVFVIGTLFVTLGVMASGAALLTYTDLFANVSTNKIELKLEETILAYELAIFETCCAGEEVRSCAAKNNVFPCYADEGTFNNFMAFLSSGGTCSFLASFEENGVPLVSQTEPESCGGQNQENFVDIISTFIEDNIQVLGTINVILAVMMLFLNFAACYLVFTTDDDLKKKTKPIDDNDLESTE